MCDGKFPTEVESRIESAYALLNLIVSAGEQILPAAEMADVEGACEPLYTVGQHDLDVLLGALAAAESARDSLRVVVQSF